MGYVNAPQGQNPWVSTPGQPQISQRAPFPSYHTSKGNPYRKWSGDPETTAGKRLGQIAYGQSMYVTEWIRPQIQADELKRQQKAQAAQGGGGAPQQGAPAGTPNGPQPPSLQGALQQAPSTQNAGDGFDPAPRKSPLAQGSPAAYKPGVGGRPSPWKDNVESGAGLAMDVATRGFGKRLATQSRVQARSPQETGPSLLGALPAPTDQVGPSAKRRGPAGMDPRKRGTWLNYE